MGISIQSLSKSYGKQKAIHQVSFSAEKGEILGFLGPNGAGKTTTMKIINGFIAPDEGTVEMDGYTIFEHPIEMRKRMGYLPEHNPLYLDMYVWEYLRFSGKLYGMRGTGLEKRIAEVIEMTGLEREQHKKTGMLSKGYRQRVGLAQSLIHDPEVLILDEPTTGLDPNQIIEIRELIREIGKEKTILFSTHILSEVEAIAGRVIIINRGEIVANETTANLRAGNENEIILKIEFEKPDFDTTLLASQTGVKRIEKETQFQFSIHCNAETEIRPKLFEESVRQENPLSSFSKVKHSLEDIFRNLTRV